MSIIKNAKKHEDKSHADANAAGAEGSTPAFEGEQEGTVVENGAGTVKTVTRSDVGAGAAAGDAGTSGDTTGSTQAEAKGTGNAGAADVGQQDSAAKASDDAGTAQSGGVLARTNTGELKSFLSGNKGMESPLRNLRGALQAAGIEINYDTFPRLRVEAGCIATQEGAEAGKWIELQVISYGPSWTLTTGVDGEESKKHVRFSNDGETVKGAGDGDEFEGMAIRSYIEHLKAIGFEKAAVKEYYNVIGMALDCEDVDFKHKNEVVSLSLAPQSKSKFDAYMVNRAFQVKMRKLVETSGNPVVRWTAERTKGKDNQAYFNLIPSHGVTEPVDLG